MMTKHTPKSTRLVNIPVKLENGDKSVLLLYTNDLTVYEGEKALMIVPIPNLSQSEDGFGFVDPSSDAIKSFRKKLYDKCEKLETVHDTLLLSAPRSITKSIKIHKVGNYKISLAPTLKDLKERIDWTKFTTPPDLETRVRTLSDDELYNFPCAYVVAEAVKSVENDGFGLIYPDCGFTYFPTAHEESVKDYKNEVELQHYDVKLYNCFAKHSDKLTITNIKGSKTHNLINASNIVEIFKGFDPSYTKSEDGKKSKFKIRNDVMNVNYISIFGRDINKNVIIDVR